jgi:hypothetical protein
VTALPEARQPPVALSPTPNSPRPSVLMRTASVTCLGAAVVSSSTSSKWVVAYEGNVVKINLRLEILRDDPIVDQVPRDAGAQHADQQRAGDRGADGPGEIVGGAAQRGHIAGQLLGRSRGKDVEHCCYQRTLSEAKRDGPASTLERSFLKV